MVDARPEKSLKQIRQYSADKAQEMGTASTLYLNQFIITLGTTQIHLYVQILSYLSISMPCLTYSPVILAPLQFVFGICIPIKASAVPFPISLNHPTVKHFQIKKNSSISNIIQEKFPFLIHSYHCQGNSHLQSSK